MGTTTGAASGLIDTVVLSATTLFALSSPNKHDGPGSPLREWSSIIGIVTAIVGNVLISFALNTQRYAHIRIDREHNEKRGGASYKQSHSQQSPNNPARRSYGTADREQEDTGERRARPNASTSQPEISTSTAATNGTLGDDGCDTNPMKMSFESDDTLTQSDREDDDGEGRQSYLKSPYWWLGIVMMVIGETGNFLAYGFAPASIVSPLGVVALISNCVIAPIMLKERFRPRDFWGVLVAIAGAVTVVLSAKESENKLGPDGLWQAIKRWEFLLYVAITSLAIVALMFASPKYGGRTILIDLGLVGLFGGYTALSTKGVASLLSYTLWRALTFPITYFLVAVLIISALMQIRYVNRALQNFDSTQVIPTQFVMFTLSVIIGSTILYRDFESATADRVGKFIGGCLLTFFGVYLITSGRGHPDDDDDEGSSALGEGIRLMDEEANYSEERMPLRRGFSKRSTRDERADPRPVTPILTGRRTPPRLSQGSPSTPTEPSWQSKHIPRSASTEHLTLDTSESITEPTPFSHSASDVPQTPALNRVLQTLDDVSTPYYTPPTTFLRTSSGPATPETPTKASKRSTSPLKADPAMHLHIAPNPLSRSARGSIGRLIPGPLTPMLSSSLSALHADSLLRGEGSQKSRRFKLRRRSLRTAGGGGGGARMPPGEESADDEISRQTTRQTEPEPEVIDIIDGEGSVGQKKSRLRAVSLTLGGLMNGVGGGTSSREKKRRRKTNDDEREDEA